MLPMSACAAIVSRRRIHGSAAFFSRSKSGNFDAAKAVSDGLFATRSTSASNVEAACRGCRFEHSRRHDRRRRGASQFSQFCAIRSFARRSVVLRGNATTLPVTIVCIARCTSADACARMRVSALKHLHASVRACVARLQAGRRPAHKGACFQAYLADSPIACEYLCAVSAKNMRDG
jgi:hypothetical protein